MEFLRQLSANQVSQINIVGRSLGFSFGKWSGLVEGKDGFLHEIPLNSNWLLRFDPVTHYKALFLLDEDCRYWLYLWGSL